MFFFNPTQEDNFPTVNLESEACETPIITYDTGGSKETINRPDSVVVQNYKEGFRVLESMYMSKHQG